MSEAQMILAALCIGAVLVIGFLIWIGNATYTEAERKLGREPTLGEVLLACFVIGAVPAEIAIVLIFVWMVMPEPRESRR